MDEYKNRFEKSLARINKYVEPTDDWTDEDYEHIKAVTDALRIASDVVKCKDCQYNVANQTPDPNDLNDYTDIVCTYNMSDGFDPEDVCSKGVKKGLIILVDSRQKKGHHRQKHADMRNAGCELLMCKLPYGDYMRGDTLPDELLTDIRALHAEYMAGREPKAKLRKSVSDRLLELHPMSVDTKQDLQEVYGNVIGDHIRFRQELETAHTGESSRLIVLIEQGEIRTLQNVHRWQNPRAIRWAILRKRGINAGRPPASSSQLQKAMETMSVKYGVKWEFCNPKDSGKRIIEILGG